MSGHQQQRCKACGRPDNFDFTVPDSVWIAVVPIDLQSRVVCFGATPSWAISRSSGLLMKLPATDTPWPAHERKKWVPIHTST